MDSRQPLQESSICISGEETDRVRDLKHVNKGQDPRETPNTASRRNGAGETVAPIQGTWTVWYEGYDLHINNIGCD